MPQVQYLSLPKGWLARDVDKARRRLAELESVMTNEAENEVESHPQPDDEAFKAFENCDHGLPCPCCGKACCRDWYDNGWGRNYGPWGCSCGWSESEEFDRRSSDGQCPGGVVDQYGVLTPGKQKSVSIYDNLLRWEREGRSITSGKVPIATFAHALDAYICLSAISSFFTMEAQLLELRLKHEVIQFVCETDGQRKGDLLEKITAMLEQETSSDKS
jgi:hypothetical protein